MRVGRDKLHVFFLTVPEDFYDYCHEDVLVVYHNGDNTCDSTLATTIETLWHAHIRPAYQYLPLPSVLQAMPVLHVSLLLMLHTTKPLIHLIDNNHYTVMILRYRV